MRIESMNERLTRLCQWAQEAEDKLPLRTFVECGVFRGKSINALAKAFPSKTIYGYDSFIGLPEAWDKGTETYPKGHFTLNGNLPPVEDNVILVEGFFEDTLPTYKGGDISFLHVDCDLYSSSCRVLSLLDEYIVPGTIIALDEYEPVSEKAKARYTTWEKHQYRALWDWARSFGRTIKVVDQGPDYEAKVRVLL